MRTISIVNQKGGCGKTTTAINVAAACAELGKRVLLVDLDPQAHVTLGLGRNPDAFAHTIYDALKADGGLTPEAVVATGTPALDLLPGNMLLARAELELADKPGRESLLDRCLHGVRDSYDLCVIDCPPSLGLLTLNAVVTTTDVIVPVQVQYCSLEGITQLLDTIWMIRDRLHLCRAVKIGLLLTFVDERSAFGRQVEEQVRTAFGDLVFKAIIRRNARLAEAPSAGKPILTYAPNSRGAADYKALAREILDGRLDVDEPPSARPAKKLPRRLAAVLGRTWSRKSASVRRRSGPDAIEST